MPCLTKLVQLYCSCVVVGVVAMVVLPAADVVHGCNAVTNALAVFTALVAYSWA
jgi:hypothetical protein